MGKLIGENFLQMMVLNVAYINIGLYNNDK